jgi:ABC-type sugar transport system, periplasmic component
MKKTMAIMLGVLLIISFILPASAFSSINVKGIKLSSSKITLKVGETTSLKVIFTPANTTQKKLSYVVANKKIATIDAAGKIKGISIGSTAITVYAQNKKISAKCNITVISSVVDNGKITIFANSGGLQNATKPSDPAYVAKMKKYIKEQTGIDVNYIAPPKDPTAEKEKLNLLLASGEEMDTFKGDVPTYANAGAIQPIDALVAKYGPNLKKLWPDTWAGGWEGMKTPDGKTWGVPELPALAGCTVYLRGDWLKKCELSSPKTIAELKNVITAFKDKDPAGNGQTIPFLVDLRGLYMAMAAGYMDIGYDWNDRGFMDKDGKFKPMVFAPGFKEFTTEMADWYAKGLIYKESFTINKDRQLELGKTNRVAASCMWYTTSTVPVQLLAEQDSNVSLVVPDPLTGPKGLTRSMTDTYQSGWLVSKRSKNPAGVIKYINWVQASLTNYNTVLSGFKGDTWDYVNYDPDGVSTIKQLVDSSAEKYHSDFMCGSSFAYTKRMTSLVDGKIPFSGAYINKYITDNTKCKVPSTFGFSFSMDKQKIIDQVGTLDDMKTFLDQGVAKFIMGARPMSEWGDFLKELDKVGLEKWENAYTTEYNKAKRK